MTTATDTLTRPEQQESKRDRFLRIGNKRLEKTLEDIRLLENLLKQPYVYDFEDKDIETITNKINAATEKLRQFTQPKPLSH